MLRKKVFLYVSFVKSVQFVCAIIFGMDNQFHLSTRPQKCINVRAISTSVKIQGKSLMQGMEPYFIGRQFRY